MSNPSQIELVVRRPEERWLLAAAREVFLGEPVSNAPSLVHIEWDFLLRQASLHALGPCLARYCETRAEEVPATVRTQLQQEQANVRAYNFFLIQELGRLTGKLAGQGVEVLAWKGPALAAAVYGDVGLRQCADLDLMIQPKQMEESIRLLEELGYREMAVDTGGHTRNLERQSPKAVVELHQMMVQPHFSVSLDAAELMSGAVSIPTMGGSIPVPAPEKLFLMLCIHGSKHVWERVIWICDVVLFIRAHPGLHWEQVWEWARQCRATRMLSLGLLLADALAEGCVPGVELKKAQGDETAVTLARQAGEWIFLPEYSHSLILRRSWFQVIMREENVDRWPLLGHLGGQLLTPGPADRAVVKLPGWLGFGYYLVRPLRLAAKVVLPKQNLKG